MDFLLIDSVSHALVAHMGREGNYRRISANVLELRRVVKVVADGVNRVEAAAPVRKIVKQARGSENARAWRRRRIPECFSAADASSNVRVGEIHTRCELEQPLDEIRMERAMHANDIGIPFV